MHSAFSLCRLRTRIQATCLAAGMTVLFAALPALAALQDATFEFHPYCIENNADGDDWIFGPIPSPGIVAETRNGDGVLCTKFDVLDPQTLRTPPLRKGDTLDIQLVIKNPGRQAMRRVRAWLSYDPNILEGTLLNINDAFAQVTPDEKNFSEKEGYAKMEATVAGKTVNDENIIFARLQFTVKEQNAIGTPITFYDVQPGGKSVIMAAEGSGETYIMKEEPGVLLVTFAESAASDVETPATAEESDGNSLGNIFDTFPEPNTASAGTGTTGGNVSSLSTAKNSGNSCVRDADCGESGTCERGSCAVLPSKLPNGSVCAVDPDCRSGLCGSGVCIPMLTSVEGDIPPEQSTGTRTAFSLLQVRNLRVTTEGSSVFLAWDPLLSSQLKAYTIYYGTTSGRYIQRKTIDQSETNVTLRSLPLEARYYFAVRALSMLDEESAFSQEVSVITGNPNSSTAPLDAGAILGSSGRNPVGNILDRRTGGNVPGETGASSTALLFLLCSAIIGTIFAFRSQLTADIQNPHV